MDQPPPRSLQVSRIPQDHQGGFGPCPTDTAGLEKGLMGKFPLKVEKFLPLDASSLVNLDPCIKALRTDPVFKEQLLSDGQISWKITNK